MDWEIVDNKPTQINEVKQEATLSTGDNLSAKLAIRKKLEGKWYNIDAMLDMAIDIAENAQKIPNWEFWPDYWKKLKALELLLDISWYTKKKAWVEVKFSLNKLLEM